jgi:hypothetical protein
MVFLGCVGHLPRTELAQEEVLQQAIQVIKAELGLRDTPWDPAAPEAGRLFDLLPQNKIYLLISL